MAEEWGPPEATRTIFFDWHDEPEGDQRKFTSNSLSGGERNRIYFRKDDNFSDMTLISGADFREDGRGFVLLDFDSDGWLDMGVTSPNHPRFRLVRNTIGDQEGASNNYLEVTLVGGQNSSETSSEWSPRDPFGSRVVVTIGDQKRMFHLACGEGLSCVNANRIHVGMGTSTTIDSLEVFWPSGKKTSQKNISSGKRITIYENPNSKTESH
jgi:hypothetical protein